MKMRLWKDLFIEQIEDLYDAGQRLVKASRKMVHAGRVFRHTPDTTCSQDTPPAHVIDLQTMGEMAGEMH